MSWNIKAGQASSLAAVAERLAILDADLVALQEVDRNAPRTGDTDQTAFLAQVLGYESVFAEAIPLDGGSYGIALLSRFPFEEATQLELSNEGASENRTALDATVCAGDHCLRILNHHADTIRLASERSIGELLEAMRADIGNGVLLAGDLNEQPSQPGPQACILAGFHDVVVDFTEAPTHSKVRIDFILADEPLALCVRRAGVVAAPESDHNAVLADFVFGDCR